MASFRAVFVIESRDAVLSKRFPTVERRAKQLAKTGNVYATIPGTYSFHRYIIFPPFLFFLHHENLLY